MFTSRSYGAREVTSLSSKKILPVVGCSKPAIIRNKVVFPQPEGPNKVINSPSPIVKSMEGIIKLLPNFLVIPSKRTISFILPLSQPFSDNTHNFEYKHYSIISYINSNKFSVGQKEFFL